MSKVETPVTPQSTEQPVTEGAGGKRLIAGKYESLEDAVEKGYKELEESHHATRQQMSELSGAVERLVQTLTPIGQSGAGARSADPYGRGSAVHDPKAELESFLADPIGVMDRRAAQHQSETLKAVGDIVTNAMAVVEFKASNADLTEHEHVVSHFMKFTSANDPIAKRLKEAGKQARAYLTTLRTKPGEENPPAKAPGAHEFVESPSGSRTPQVTKKDEAEKDESLADYVAERNASRAKKFGMNVKVD